MLHITVSEFGRIPKDRLTERQLSQLQRFDERSSHTLGGTVFDWGHVNYIRAANYVGVVQVENVAIEILPKIGAEKFSTDDGSHDPWARHNLLYMLSFSRDLPVKDRDLAQQNLRNMPLIEALIAGFADRLLNEFRCGLDHAYLHRQENLRIVKGKILLSQHLKINTARPDQIFVAYDDFSSDTLLNRILKATCRSLIRWTSNGETEQKLRTAVLQLSEISDLSITSTDFDRIHLNRSSERFKSLLGFCRLVHEQMTPAAFSGSAETFSLLFPMDQLFEEFIGAFLRKHAEMFGTRRRRIHLQAKNRRRWLLRADDHGVFRLKPDILIEDEGGNPALIVDTKWKCLLDDNEDRKNGVSQADIYQMYAYANRYASQDNILLFPRIPGATAKQYWLEADAQKRRIRTAFVDLSYDLATNVHRLKTDLADALLH